MSDPSPQRRAMTAKLHLARKQLALTEDSYRDVLRRITGKESAREMDLAELDRALGEFKRLGFRAKSARTYSAKAQVRMIRAVWADIVKLQGRGTEEALRSFVQRQTKSPAHPDGIASPEFLDGQMGGKVLEGLKSWRRRLRAQEAAA